MTRSSSRAWMLIALLLPAAPAKSASFPGVEQLPAPNGQFVVRYEAHVPGADESHQVRLVDRRTGKFCWALTFERSVDVLWSPSGSALAVTDWAGSNLASLTVILPEAACREISLQEELVRSLGAEALPKDPNHIYFEARRWRAPAVLEFHVWGDTGSESRESFDQHFEFTVGGQVRRTKSPP